LPLISRIPVLGGLFGSQSIKVDRVELVIFITPRVIEGDSGAAEVIEDLRKRMERLDFAFPITTQTPEPALGDKAKRAFDELFPVLTPMRRGTFYNAPSGAPAPPDASAPAAPPGVAPSATPAPAPAPNAAPAAPPPPPNPSAPPARP
jgi:hypothetical protein